MLGRFAKKPLQVTLMPSDLCEGSLVAQWEMPGWMQCPDSYVLGRKALGGRGRGLTKPAMYIHGRQDKSSTSWEAVCAVAA